MNHPALEIDYDPCDELKLRHELLRAQQPGLRARDAAHALNVSEAELVACHAGDTTFHLIHQPEALLEALQGVGELLMVTRNDGAVLEKKGVCENISVSEQQGLCTAHCRAAGMDLRLLLNTWHDSFLVVDESHAGHRESLQFFDANGEAVLKIYLTRNSDPADFEAIITRFISPQQPTWLDLPARQQPSPQAGDEPVAWHQLRQGWQEMQSSHDFFQLLIGCRLTRQQAYDNVGSDLAYEVVPDALPGLLREASKLQLGLNIAVGNPGCMQFHNGPVERLTEYGPWLNILDADMNLHIHQHKITQAWVVRKPHKDGPVTTLEFFDHHDQLILQLSAQRQASATASSLWQDLIAQLEPRTLDIGALNTSAATLLDLRSAHAS